MDLLKNVGLMKIVLDTGPCYEKLVKKFIVNFSNECNIEGSREFRKVFVKGYCVKFSPKIINQYLGISKKAEVDEVPSMDKIVITITTWQVKQWPKKGLITPGCLSVKYAIMKKIGETNQALINHNSGITLVFAKLVYQIKAKSRLNFGEYVLNQTMKHADSYEVKLLIDFPCLITGIILNQHPNIVNAKEIKNKKPGALTLDYMLIVGTHVP